MLKGRVGITAGKKVYILSEGQMTFHRPGEFHAIWEEGDTSPEVIVFSFSAAPFPTINGYVYELGDVLINEIKELYDELQGAFIIGEVPPMYKLSLVERRGKAELSSGIYVAGVKVGREVDALKAVKRLEIFLLSAIDSLSEEHEEGSGRGGENYTRILSVMEDNLEKNLSVSELAELCKMSVPTLEKTVFKYLHSGAMSYYNVLRMEKALAMLSVGSSVKEVSLALGFSNQNYFSACFKKRYGFSPSEVKKQNEQKIKKGN